MLSRSDIGRAERAAANTLLLLDHALGRRRVDRLFAGARRRLQHRIADRLSSKGEGKLVPVPRERDLSVQAFKQRYLRPGLPVILEGAARDWPCVGKWSLDYFLEHYGDYEAPVRPSEGLSGHHIEDAQETETLREVITGLRSGGSSYVRFDPIVEQFPELQQDFDLDLLKSLRNVFSLGAGYQSFLGGPGGTTHLHCAMPSNLFVMVHGEKRWQLYPAFYTPVIQPPANRAAYNYSYVDIHQPDPDVYPGFRYLDGWEVHLKPGDVFYNPPFMWHEVVNLTEAIGVGYRFTYMLGAFRASTILTLMRLTGTDPPIWQPLLNALRNRQVYAHAYQKRPNDAPLA